MKNFIWRIQYSLESARSDYLTQKQYFRWWLASGLVLIVGGRP